MDLLHILHPREGATLSSLGKAVDLRPASAAVHLVIEARSPLSEQACISFSR